MATYNNGQAITIYEQATVGDTPFHSPRQWALCTYLLTTFGGAGGAPNAPSMEVVFGPTNTIPATITVNTSVYTFRSGVIFQASP